MSPVDFFPYHNRHIVFKLKNGAEMSGVLTDPMNHHETGKRDTVYTYIATRNMVAWKKAEREGLREAMKRLESEIDISEIVWAERLNY